MTGVLLRRHTGAHEGSGHLMAEVEVGCSRRLRNWPMIASRSPKLGRGKEGVYSEFQKEHGLAQTLILYF